MIVQRKQKLFLIEQAHIIKIVVNCRINVGCDISACKVDVQRHKRYLCCREIIETEWIQLLYGQVQGYLYFSCVEPSYFIVRE
jgi:hypothetical protein